MSGLRVTAIACNWASVSGAWPGGHRLGRRGNDVQVGKEGLNLAALLFGRRGPRADRRQTQRRRRAARDRTGDFQRLNGHAAAGLLPGLHRPRAGIRRLARAGCPAGSARHPGPRVGNRAWQAVPAAERGSNRDWSRRRFLRRRGRRRGRVHGAAAHGSDTAVNPALRVVATTGHARAADRGEGEHAVRWSSPHGKPRKASYRLKLKLLSYGLYRAWQT